MLGRRCRLHGRRGLLHRRAPALVQLPVVPPEPSGVRGPPGAAGGARRVVGLGSVLDGLRYLVSRPSVRTAFLVDLAALVFARPRVLFLAGGVVVVGGGEATTGALTAALVGGRTCIVVLLLLLLRRQPRPLAYDARHPAA